MAGVSSTNVYKIFQLNGYEKDIYLISSNKTNSIRNVYFDEKHKNSIKRPEE